MLGSNSVSYYRRNGDGEHRAAAKWNSALHISETPNKRLVHSLWVCRLSSYSWKLCPNSLCVKHYRHRPVAKGGPKGAVPTRQIFVPPRRFWHCSTNSGLVKCSRMCICNLENYKHTICGCICRRGLIRCFRISSSFDSLCLATVTVRSTVIHLWPWHLTLDARMQELGYHHSNSWIRFASGGLYACVCVCARQRLLWVHCIIMLLHSLFSS